MTGIYTHGHHESVLRSHSWRTAENSAGYLLDHLRPGMDVLDVGCGPATITADLAHLVAPGRTVGVDVAPGIVVQAAALAAERGSAHLVFATASVDALPFAGATFDVAHAHQVLQHLPHPVRALREMRRVLRPGGLLAVRDSDYTARAYAPRDPLLDRWLELYHQVTAHNGAEADAGRHLLGWARAAGFEDVRASSSTWTFADPRTRAWWGGLWADRVRKSAFADQAVEYALSTPDELAAIAAAWRRWAEHPDGFLAILHGEVLARRP
ncbi:MAG TPA: methyltransferase domain-containing protein [Candidatus Dormibacteraeota bacterium]|nr:methyltransferase domain-containing protein [Candidatus Dormibacteraeota bacterium]